MYSPQEEQHLYTQAKKLLKEKDNLPDELPILRKAIFYADWKYYVQNDPVLSDFEYDSIFSALKSLEVKHPDLVTPDSPTQRVALGLSERFPAVSHLVPMLSLDNTYNAEDLADWDKRCHDLAGPEKPEYCVEPKYDGASISLIYTDDLLSRGATRGDGVMGEDVTANIRQIKAIPLSAAFRKYGIQQIEIRGEIVIHKKVFEAFNKQRAAEGLSPLANPRNAASGTLRMLDPNEVKKRGLNAILYHISYYTLLPGHERPDVLNDHYASLKWLYGLGFPTPTPDMEIFDNVTPVIKYCHDFEAKRDLLPFEVDGLVIKVNKFSLQETMGMTTHHPRWAVAYKFKARQATSKLLRVEFQVGRTGAITPVAKIEPVHISGVTVSSVSLFNEDVVREKDVRVGDTVLVERAGDVIPYIVKPLADLRDGTEQPIVFPSHCPACNSELEKQPDEAAWRCININCPVQVVERVIHFASKDAMDIRSLGPANIQKFYENGIIADIPSIYDIDWSLVAQLEGLGEKSITNLRKAIAQSKQQPLSRLIYGLGIRYVGETTAKTLASAVAHIFELYKWDTDRLITLDDVGPKVATAVADFFIRPENREIINRLQAAGVNLSNDHKGESHKAGGLSGKTFLFTGTLSQLKRSEAEAKVEEEGGIILSGVSSKLNYLITGEDAGSKLEKAKKLGTVNILTESEFLKLVNN